MNLLGNTQVLAGASSDCDAPRCFEKAVAQLSECQENQLSSKSQKACTCYCLSPLQVSYLKSIVNEHEQEKLTLKRFLLSFLKLFENGGDFHPHLFVLEFIKLLVLL